jgi:hypothetical protein
MSCADICAPDRTRTCDLGITRRYDRTTPIVAPIVLCDKSIGDLITPVTTGQFRSIPGHSR